MIIQDLISLGTSKIKDIFPDSARFEAEFLLTKILNKDRVFLITNNKDQISQEAEQKYLDWIARRQNGEPVAYIVGEKDFYKNTFRISPGVLIPRPETEIIVETAVKFLKNSKKDRFKIIDMGCGSGCIGLSILGEVSGAFLYAVDQSMQAVLCTAQNAEKTKLSGRVTIFQKDILTLADNESFDCVVANPPYISPDDPSVDPYVKKYEPQEALFANEGGMKKIREWTGKAYQILLPGGLFVCEIGMSQGERAKEILIETGFVNVEIIKDLSRKDRTVLGFKHG